MGSVGIRNLSPVPKEDIDCRSDEEICHHLKEFSPPTSEKNVWAYWHTGFNTAPPWIQRNIIGWVRKLGPSWTVRVVDSVAGSPTHVSQYVGSESLSQSFNEGTMSGPFAAYASSDFVRLALLILHGGVWMDASVILVRHLDDIWSTLQDPSSPYEAAAMVMPMRPDGEPSLINGFLAAPKGNEFIKRWHQIYLAAWKGRTDSVGAHATPLLRHLRVFVPPAGEPRAPNIQWSAGGMTDYLTHLLCAERLRDLVDPHDGFNGRLYFQTKMYLLPALREMHYFQLRSGWDGHEEFRLLATRCSGDNSEPGQDDQFLRARDMVHEMLEKTAMIKLSHGPKGVTKPWLADLWNTPEHKNSDNEPGTFAAYLRRKIVEFNQTRPLQPLEVGGLKAKLWTSGLLEPCR